MHALTLAALAFFHHRLDLASTRVTTPLDYHEAQLEPVDRGRELWESWVAHGGDAGDFEAWLDRPLAQAGGAPPLRWLDRGQHKLVDEAMRRELLSLVDAAIEHPSSGAPRQTIATRREIGRRPDGAWPRTS